MSDDEAFASAEEGEEEAKGSKEKSTVVEEQSKSGQAAPAEKGGAKPKGKQQQRKKKGKAQGKATAEEKGKASQKTSREKSSVKADTSTVQAKEFQPTPAASVESQAPVSQSSELVQPSTKDSIKADSVSDKQDSKHEDVKDISTTEGLPDTKYETPRGQKQEVLTDQDADKSVESKSETQPDKDSEISAKSAGDVRQSLSKNTTGEDARLGNSGEQSIPRDADGASPNSGEEKLAEDGAKDEGSWNWGWGSSILNAATNSLETFSSQVGEGLTTIIDSVESSLGVPSPEDVAKADSPTELDTVPGEEDTVTAQPHEKEASEEALAAKRAAETQKGEEDKEAEQTATPAAQEEEDAAKAEGSWLSGWGMSSISNMGKSLVNKSQNLMNTGFEKAENLAAGGLDILETIGKKTYTTLTEHDPGLRRAREFLHLRDEKPSLSSMLREAQEQADVQAKRDEESEEALKVNFTALFEDNQGLAHLEALEMLSNRSERKVQSLLSAMEEDMLENIRPQLVEIKDTFQQAFEKEEAGEESEHDFSKLVTENLSELHLGTAPDKLNKVQENVRQWIADFYSHEDHSEISDAKEVQQRAIQSLADVTSKAVEQFHKAGELVLMQKDEEKSYTHRAQSLAKLSSVLVTEVDILASKFSQCLNKIGEEKKTTEEVNPMVTSVYLEASNASGYIQDAFQLLLPVLQHAAIQSALALSL
ncbi:protein FAM114A2-like [Littorina saxatilis]|uniref:Protein FAM114A2 n=1 Tax=Littorina saxatilis TaxID=31220 RepID=A0AAN9B1Q7_9CAEN